MTSLVSSTTWIRRGAATPHPKRYHLDEKELERVASMAGGRLEQVKEELLQAQLHAQDTLDPDDDTDGTTQALSEGDNSSGQEQIAENGDWTDLDVSDCGMELDQQPDHSVLSQKVDRVADDLAEYNLDNYDNEKSKGASMGAFSNVRGLQYYANPGQDPHVTLNDLEDEENEEREELEIYPTDSLIVAAKTEDDVSQLEIYVYDEAEENLYIHHDLLLPALPLCLEWIDYIPASIPSDDPSRKGNFIAVGTMDPEIEVWSLDVLDGLYPDAILGLPSRQSDGCDPTSVTCDKALQCSPGEETMPEKKKKKKKKKHASNPPSHIATASTHHTSSVLSLSHNKMARNLLLSSSADMTIKLWDMNVSPSSSSAFSAIGSFHLHQDKVQSAQWNPKEPSIVVSGGWDKLIKVWDYRNSDDGVEVKVDADVECLRWNTFDPFNFLVSLDNGLIQSYDSRFLPKFGGKASKARTLWTLSAHDSSVSAMDINSIIPGLLITGGVDKMVKIWNIDKKDSTPSVSMVVSRDLDVGKVFSTTFCPDSATTAAIAGSKANMRIWDIATNRGVRTVFGDRLRQYTNLDMEKREKEGNNGVISVANDAETDDEAE